MLGAFFAAPFEEIGRYAEGGYPDRSVDAKGLTPVSLATLAEILGVGSYDDLFPSIADGGVDAQNGEQGVFPLPDAYRDALASTQDVDEIAAKWAATEELTLDRWETSVAAAVLRDATVLARNAREGGEALLFWWSL
jgi:hypothetical protein